MKVSEIMRKHRYMQKWLLAGEWVGQNETRECSDSVMLSLIKLCLIYG